MVGLLTDDRTDLSAEQRTLAQPRRPGSGRGGCRGRPSWPTSWHNVDVGVLLGLSTAAGAFTEADRA